MARYFGYYTNLAQGKGKKGKAMRCGFIPPMETKGVVRGAGDRSFKLDWRPVYGLY
jgi:hypothetical protein